MHDEHAVSRRELAVVERPDHLHALPTELRAGELEKFARALPFDVAHVECGTDRQRQRQNQGDHGRSEEHPSARTPGRPPGPPSAEPPPLPESRAGAELIGPDPD